MTSMTAMSFYHKALLSAIKSGTEGFNNRTEYKKFFLHEQELMHLEMRQAAGPFRALSNHAFHAWF